jgi:hypothetical protein
LGVDVNLGADLGAHIAAGGKLVFNNDFEYSLTKLGSKACLTPKAGVSLNVDIAQADTPEDPMVEKTVAVCQLNL